MIVSAADGCILASMACCRRIVSVGRDGMSCPVVFSARLGDETPGLSETEHRSDEAQLRLLTLL